MVALDIDLLVFRGDTYSVLLFYFLIFPTYLLNRYYTSKIHMKNLRMHWVHLNLRLVHHILLLLCPLEEDVLNHMLVLVVVVIRWTSVVPLRTGLF